MVPKYVLTYLIAGLLSVAVWCGVSKADSTALAKLKTTTVYIQGERMTGSGAVIRAPSGRHLIITAQHVCKDALTQGVITSIFDDGSVTHSIVLKSNPKLDLCVVGVTEKTEALNIAMFALLPMEVNTRGYPGGHLVVNHGTYRDIEAWTNISDSVTYIVGVANIYVRPGSSGSPVVDDFGDLVGVVLKWDTKNPEYAAGLAPLDDIKAFMSGL